MVTSVRSEREKTKYSKCKTFGFKRKFRKNLFCLYYEYFIVYSMENTSFFPSRLQFSVSQLYKYIDSKSEKQLSRSISLDNAPLNRFQSRIHRFTIDNLIKSQLTFFFFSRNVLSHVNRRHFKSVLDNVLVCYKIDFLRFDILPPDTPRTSVNHKWYNYLSIR